MAKYIDAEKLIKAIEEKGFDCSFALKMERLDTLALIDSLQQEQPEVDLEQEYKNWWNSISGKINVEHIMEYYMHETARHFYELGKNSK